jgi:hypothetical protein
VLLKSAGDDGFSRTGQSEQRNNLGVRHAHLVRPTPCRRRPPP